MLYFIRKKWLFVVVVNLAIWGFNQKPVFSGTHSMVVTGDEKNQGPILFSEGFESGMPAGWVQQYINTPGGYKVNWNIRKGAGYVAGFNWGEPDTAAVGDRNLTFQFQGEGHITRITTSPINLEFAVNPVLSFYHAQVEWLPEKYDMLKVYYRKGENGTWQYLQQFNHATQGWVHRSILLTDHDSDKVYFAFEGHNNYGFGVCVDEIKIIETGIIPRAIDNVVTEQASTDFVPSGSINNPIIKSIIRVTGNTGNLKLNRFTVQSLNTNNADISAIKLFYTPDQGFSTQFLLGQATSFQGGTVVFDNLNFDLPTGYSNFWVTYDVAQNATHGNFADAQLPVGGIGVNSLSFPVVIQNPVGRRMIYESVYYDDFSTDKGWFLNGEWEIAVPKGFGGTFGSNGSNGSVGHPGASFPFVGTRVLGTDITGLGDYPGNYEPALDSLEWVAVSPPIDCFYFKDVTLTFQRWLNVEATDKVYIHISNDDGLTWKKVWENNDFFSALNWKKESLSIPIANRKQGVRIRFAIGSTDYTNQYSGWNIDNLFVTGTYVTQDAGIKSWVSPKPYCGMSNNETVRVEVKNYGAKNITSPIPVGYSLDGGITWRMSVVNGGIPFGGSVVHTFPQKADFSVPGRYKDILVRVFWDLDQDTTNDVLEHSIFSVPHIVAPYTEMFINSDGLWTGYGENSTWQWAMPSGPAMQSAHSGQRAWFTNPDGAYKPQEKSWLESPCFSFAGVSHPVLEFYLKAHTPLNNDGAGIEYTLDEGITWQLLEPMTQALAWNWVSNPVSALFNAYGHSKGWSGNQQQWRRVRAVLGEEIANHPKVKFRLVFASTDFNPVGFMWEGIGFDSFSLFTAPHDVGVDALVNPVHACELTGEQSFTISVKNFGVNTLPAGVQIPAGLEVENESTSWQVFTLASPLSPGNTVHFTFNQKYDISALGPHQVKAFTALPGDSDFYKPGFYNDTLVTQVIVRGFPEPFPMDTLYVANAAGYMLDAGEQYTAYKWFDNSTDRFLPITNPYSATYSAMVTDIYGCQGSGSVLLLTYDIEIAKIIAPENACELTESEKPSVRIINHGPETFAPGHKFPLKTELNGQIVARDTLVVSQSWMPGTEIIFTISGGIDMKEVKTHNLKVSMGMCDVNATNDAALKNVQVYGYPNVFLPPFIATNQPQNVVLDPNAGTNTCLWHDGSTNPTFQVSAWGEHWVIVTSQFGCKTLAVTTLYPAVPDIAVDRIIEPAFVCAGAENNQLKVMLKNSGFMVINAGTQVKLSFRLGSGVEVEETFTLAQPFLPQTSRPFTFTQLFAAPQPGTNLTIHADLPGDAVEANNSITRELEVKTLPVVNLGGDRYITNPVGMVLNAGQGFAAYKWHDGSGRATFTINNQQSQTYSVKVTDQNGCSASDTIKVVTYNLSLDKIVSPRSHCEFSDSERIEVRVYNDGFDSFVPGSKIRIGFMVDGNQVFTEEFELITAWNANTARNFKFNNTIDLTTKSTFDVKAWVVTQNAVPENDFHIAKVVLTEKPKVSLGGHIYTLHPETITLDAGAGFASYLWQDNSQGQIHQVSSIGWKWVIVTDQYGCVGSDTIYIGYTNIAGWQKEFVSKVYPNPARNVLNIELENIPATGMELTLMDMNGRLIFRDVAPAEKWYKNSWFTEGLSPGIYLINLSSQGYLKTHRVAIAP